MWWKRSPRRLWRVALTGTPGVGKTTLAAEAAKAGWTVVDVKEWAKREDCVAGYDEADGAIIVDVKALAKRMPKGQNFLFEGHLSHLLPVDCAWVVRCDPDVLRPRLSSRGYSPAKVAENLEAEALDIILQEALDAVPLVIQRDGTRRSPPELFKSFAEVRLDKAKRHDLEPVDWSDRLPLRMP